MPLVMRQSTGGFQKFCPVLCARAVSHVKIWCIISVVLYLAVPCSVCLGRLLMCTGELASSGDDFSSWGAILGSTVDTVHASTLAFRSISHIFYVAADSIPDCVFLSISVLNGEEWPSLTLFGCSFLLRAVSHLDHWTIFSSFT